MALVFVFMGYQKALSEAGYFLERDSGGQR